MIPLAEARRSILAQLAPLPAVPVPLAAALDSVVAEDLVSPGPVPPFANSAMDGYAVRAADTEGAPVELRVVAIVAAGQAATVPVGPGQAVRIMTGAVLPEGADAVCLQEATTAGEGTVVIEKPVHHGEAVRLPGEDVAAGEVLAARGTLLRPGHLGVLANGGITSVPVHHRPRVAVLSTGDELVEAGATPGPAQIRDANRPTLLALLARSGIAASDRGIVGDDVARVTEVVEEAAADHDVVVVSGGVSVGDFDVVRIGLDQMTDGAMQWMQVAIKPAKPLAFGLLPSGAAVFGLPGNPVSAMVSYELFVRPALRLLAGHRVLDRPAAVALADEDLTRAPDGKVHFVRVGVELHADGRVRVRPSGGQGSHQLSAMARADGLAVLADGEGVRQGGPVPVLLLEAGEAAPPAGVLPW